MDKRPIVGRNVSIWIPRLIRNAERKTVPIVQNDTCTNRSEDTSAFDTLGSETFTAEIPIWDVKTMARATVIKSSPIHGKGLFAVRSFSKGESVEGIDGEYVLGTRKSKYAISLKDGRSLLLHNKVKYVNFSTTPNVEFDLKRFALVAVRPITAGDELTSTYDSIFA